MAVNDGLLEVRRAGEDAPSGLSSELKVADETGYCGCDGMG